MDSSYSRVLQYLANPSWSTIQQKSTAGQDSVTQTGENDFLIREMEGNGGLWENSSGQSAKIKSFLQDTRSNQARPSEGLVSVLRRRVMVEERKKRLEESSQRQQAVSEKDEDEAAFGAYLAAEAPKTADTHHEAARNTPSLGAKDGGLNTQEVGREDTRAARPHCVCLPVSHTNGYFFV